jgi:hypothetical protein
MRTEKTTADGVKGCSTMADPAYVVQMQFELKASYDACTSYYFVPSRLVVAADCGSDAVDKLLPHDHCKCEYHYVDQMQCMSKYHSAS